jgi:hypothetical protein
MKNMTKKQKTTIEVEIHEINLESLYRYTPQFIELAAIEYVKQKNCDLVTLYDGYEKTIVLIREKNI